MQYYIVSSVHQLKLTRTFQNNAAIQHSTQSLVLLKAVYWRKWHGYASTV